MKIEVTEMETTPDLSCMNRSSGFTCEQFQELKKKKKHFKTDSNPNEKTLEDLANTLKLTKGGDIRVWFLYQRHEMELKQLSKAPTSELESRDHTFGSHLVGSYGSKFGLRVSLMYF